eukprot:Phypoly_transcript_01880.p1 GENE.Phypoly_transcript_01880~~Phypoly_transcript_01880.p1  ORF type:complete len:531 (+),score=96.77 Phypoly_transcript_01880:1380-2972(+)
MSIILLLLLGLVQVSLSSYPYYTIFKDQDGYKVKNVKDDSGVVTAYYEDKITSTGWAFLNLKSNVEFSDYDQMYAAGYLEGSLTTDLIYNYYQNIFAGEYNNTDLPEPVLNWLSQNNAYMLQQIKENPSDPYWVHIGLILTQLQGLLDGYNSVADSSKQMTFTQFMIINMDGDMADLLAAFNVSDVDWSDDMSVIRHYIYNTHCSVLVKLADDLSELYAGHTTWSGYYEMVRIYKTYDLPISVQQASPITTFSGYPAALSSVDDWYVLNSGLIVTETTNGVMNNSLYSAVVPTTVLSFIRVLVANKMSANGSDWVSTFSKQNSGTYNNQWIIVDTNKLDAGNELKAGALYILEQIPGYIESADVTGILSYGYWPSYNVPYFPNIYQISGFGYYAQKYGPFFSYENNPRAEIFRRDSAKVDSIDKIQKALRYNDYTHDPLSHGSPGFAISSRFDLVTGNVTNPFLVSAAFGGIDSKISSATLAKNLTSYVQSGPSYDHVPPFAWSPQWDDVAHFGLPDVWDFPWVLVQYSP